MVVMADHHGMSCEVISASVGQKSGRGESGSPTLPSRGWDQGVSGLCPYLELRVPVGNTQVCVAVTLRSQGPQWSAGRLLSALGGSWAPGHIPLHLQSQQGSLSLVENPPKTWTLTSRSLSHSIRFKGVTDSIVLIWTPTSPQSQRCQETEPNLCSDLHTPSPWDPTSERGGVEGHPQLCLPHVQSQPQVDARSNSCPGTRGHVPALCGSAQQRGK